MPIFDDDVSIWDLRPIVRSFSSTLGSLGSTSSRSIWDVRAPPLLAVNSPAAVLLAAVPRTGIRLFCDKTDRSRRPCCGASPIFSARWGAQQSLCLESRRAPRRPLRCPSHRTATRINRHMYQRYSCGLSTRRCGEAGLVAGRPASSHTHNCVWKVAATVFLSLATEGRSEAGVKRHCGMQSPLQRGPCAWEPLTSAPPLVALWMFHRFWPNSVPRERPVLWDLKNQLRRLAFCRLQGFSPDAMPRTPGCNDR